MNMDHRLTICVLCFVLPSFSCGATPPPPTAEEIEELISMLASPNERPLIKSCTAKYPGTYDHTVQKQIRTRFLRLQRFGVAAFPNLIEHFEDQAYSLTEDAGFCDEHWTVGRLSKDAITTQIQPYGRTFARGEGDPRFVPRRPSYFGQHPISTREQARVWWEARKGKSLRDIQLEALEWVVAEEAKIAKDYSDEERKYLRDLLTTLRASDQPLKAGVPWAR